MFIKVIFVLGILQVLQQPVQVKCQVSGDQDILTDNFPWHAFIKMDFNWCHGVLISPDYVILPANCVNGSSTAIVYLGVRCQPFFTSECQDNNTQVIESTQILVHKDCKKVNSFVYQNNIALVKLATPATLTHAVQPGILARDTSQLVEGQLFRLLAFNYILDKLTLVNVSFVNDNACVDIFKDDFLKDQEFCLKEETKLSPKSYLDLFGNSVSLDDNTIVGVMTVNGISGLSCHHVALNIVPYLNWISLNTNIDKSILTGDHYQLHRKTIISHENTTFKLENNTTSINTLLTDISIKQISFEERLGRIETAENDMKQMLDKISQQVAEISQQNTISINKLLTDRTAKQNTFEDRLRRIESAENDTKQTLDKISRQVAEMSQKNTISINKLLTDRTAKQNTFEDRLRRIESAENDTKQTLDKISQQVAEIRQQNTISINKLLTDTTVKQNTFEETLVDIGRQVGDMAQQVADLSNKTRCLAEGFFLST